MDPDDRLRSLLPGMRCTVCGSMVHPATIRVLAQRDDLAFLQLPCASCGSTTLGMIVAGDEDLDADAPDDDAAVDAPSGIDPADAPPIPSAPPIDRADVEAMRDLLARHRGDFGDLLRGRDEGGRP